MHSVKKLRGEPCCVARWFVAEGLAATASRESHLGCVRVQQQLAKETKVIAALKQHYERYHAEDLAPLKELYEYHAENCVRAAELTDDPRRREENLKLARAWTEAATTIQKLTYGMMARRSNQAKLADDAPSLTSRTRRRMASRNPRKRPVSDN
jgi:hypothetical protein